MVRRKGGLSDYSSDSDDVLSDSGAPDSRKRMRHSSSPEDNAGAHKRALAAPPAFVRSSAAVSHTDPPDTYSDIHGYRHCYGDDDERDDDEGKDDEDNDKFDDITAEELGAQEDTVLSPPTNDAVTTSNLSQSGLGVKDTAAHNQYQRERRHGGFVSVGFVSHRDRSGTRRHYAGPQTHTSTDEGEEKQENSSALLTAPSSTPNFVSSRPPAISSIDEEVDAYDTTARAGLRSQTGLGATAPELSARRGIGATIGTTIRPAQTPNFVHSSQAPDKSSGPLPPGPPPQPPPGLLPSSSAPKAHVSVPVPTERQNDDGGQSHPHPPATTSNSKRVPPGLTSSSTHSPAGQGKHRSLKEGGAPPSRSQAQYGTSIKFSKGGFNPAQMLAKMGWTGGGLGKEGQGIQAPIDVKLRPERAGMGYGGRKEMTDQNRVEAKRRGQLAESDEEASPAPIGQTKNVPSKSSLPAWKRKKSQQPRTKVAYSTYEELISQAGAQLQQPSVGPIIDATGRELREVSSVADALAGHALPGVPTSETQGVYIPELVSNMAQLALQTQTQVQELARQGATLQARGKFTERDLETHERVARTEENKVGRLEHVVGLVDQLETLSQKFLSQLDATLDSFSPTVQHIIEQTKPGDVQELGLDELVVGAVAPLLRRLVQHWSPLEQPTTFTSQLAAWAPLLRKEEDEGRSLLGKTHKVRVMTPYEALIWHIIMPRIRTVLNNEWQPRDPHHAIAWTEAWIPILPRFIRDNVMDQLIVPKVQRFLETYPLRPRRDARQQPSASLPALHKVVFPWLPFVPGRTLLSSAKHTVYAMLRAWRPPAPPPESIKEWKHVFGKGEWQRLIRYTVVATLRKALKHDLKINPSQQNLDLVDSLLAWTPLLETQDAIRLWEYLFLPWLSVLHAWLVQPTASLLEVGDWFSWWKKILEPVQHLPSVQQGLTAGLELIDKAMDLEETGARTSLPQPDVHRTSQHARVPPAPPAPSAPAQGGTEETLSFHHLVEEKAAEADLLVQPLHRIDPGSGQRLYRISRTLDGKHGTTFYVLDNVVWMQLPENSFVPAKLQDLFAQASA